MIHNEDALEAMKNPLSPIIQVKQSTKTFLRFVFEG